MLEVWQGIDPELAEARLQGLRRRLSELDDALADQQALARKKPQSFGIALTGKSLRSMEGALRSELSEILRFRQAEQITLVLNGPQYLQHTAKIADLGYILTRIQKLFSSVAQAITTGPTTRGPIASEIVRKSTLRLQEIYPSSFGMRIAVASEYNMLGESLSSDALTQMFQLLTSTQSDSNLMRVSGEVGRRSLVHLRHLATYLQANEASVNIGWRDFAGTQYCWEAESGSATAIINSIDQITEKRSETKDLKGWLVGASLLRDRFEIISDERHVVEGKFLSGMAREIQQYFGKHVIATVDETEVSDRISGESKTYYALRSIRSSEDYD